MSWLHDDSGPRRGHYGRGRRGPPDPIRFIVERVVDSIGRPTHEEIQTLVESGGLSSEARQVFADALAREDKSATSDAGETKYGEGTLRIIAAALREHFGERVKEAMQAREGEVSSVSLERFFASDSLSDADRRRLLDMPADAMQEELRKLYRKNSKSLFPFIDSMPSKRGEGPRGPGRESDDDRERGGRRPPPGRGFGPPPHDGRPDPRPRGEPGVS